MKANKYRYIIYKITADLKAVEVEKVVPLNAATTYQDFLNDLPADDCRYGIYNYEYDFEATPRSKIIFYQWAPETSKTKVKQRTALLIAGLVTYTLQFKMIYASTKDSMKKALIGMQIEIQGTDKSEVEEKVVLDRCISVSK